jgi:hypothetical protein
VRYINVDQGSKTKPIKAPKKVPKAAFTYRGLYTHQTIIANLGPNIMSEVKKQHIISSSR